MNQIKTTNVEKIHILSGAQTVPNREDVPQRQTKIHIVGIKESARDIRHSRSCKKGSQMNNAQLINQDSGNFEYYTPIEIVEAARNVMGSIDLDPASSAMANKRIKATRFYSCGGLDKPWFGNVWMNHPFSRENNPQWIKKLINEYNINPDLAACCITYVSTSEKWFRPLLDFPQCFLFPRTNYYTPDGEKKTGVTKGSVVSYLGVNREKFVDVFHHKFGVVK